MYSFRTSGYSVTVNDDYDETVTIQKDGKLKFSIPVEILKYIVADWVRVKLIHQLEAASVDEILFGNLPHLETRDEHTAELEKRETQMRDQGSKS